MHPHSEAQKDRYQKGPSHNYLLMLGQQLSLFRHTAQKRKERETIPLNSKS